MFCSDCSDRKAYVSAGYLLLTQIHLSCIVQYISAARIAVLVSLLPAVFVLSEIKDSAIGMHVCEPVYAHAVAAM